MTPVKSTWLLLVLLVLVASHVTNIQARYHHIRLRHDRHRRQHGESYAPSNYILENEEPEQGSWGPWSHPTSCSRTCGGGVAHQTRDCLDRDDYNNERCTGSRKRYFSCNIQPCSGEQKDFRSEQCAEFNNKPFEGVYYDWIPYTGGHNKCELNCMPRGERFFYRHREIVIDGTLCNVEKNDVCVEGKCMPVGCDMMLGSNAKEDACRECGGDGSDCNTVKGLFDAVDLQVGYLDILLIPEGATNIIVKEIKPSNNYLAIRNTTGHYYLNGNWRIDFPRSLRFAGTIFHYNREPQGFSAPDTISALGPTTEAVYIVLLYQDYNVGVEYQYSIPKKFSQQSDPDSYTWVADEFSSCSTTCGGGYQSRHVSCMKRRTNEEADEKLCDPMLEPADTQACGNEPCPAQWVASDWSPCNKQCGQGGEQTRDIQCRQILFGGTMTVVDERQCLDIAGPKNNTKQKCNENVECPQWHLGPWKPCDSLCGEGKQRRKVTCYRKSDEGKVEVLDDSNCEGEVPEKEKICQIRPCEGVDWLVSPWSGCTEKCGLTQETRTVQCTTENGTVYPKDMCDSDKKPKVTKECETSQNCEYQWIKTQWSKCSANCGTGIQTRKVFCATFEDEDTMKKVPDSKCDPEEKFNTTRNCTTKNEECKGEWFAGPWSQCTKPCGGGKSIRKVICLKDNKTVSSTQCDYETIMDENEDCNTQACEEDEVIPVESEKVTALMEEEEEECEDEEDFVTVSSSFETNESEESSEMTEAVPLSSPLLSDSTDNTGSTIYDMMFSDASSRGDVPISTEYGSGSTGSDDDTGYPIITTLEGSGTTSDDFENTVFGSTDFDTSESSGASEITDKTEISKSDTTESSFSTEETVTISGVSESWIDIGSTTVFEQSTEKITKQSTEQSLEQSSEQSSEQSTEESTEQSSVQSTEQSTDQSTEQSSEQSTEKSSNEFSQQSTEQVTLQSSEETSDSSSTYYTTEGTDASIGSSESLSESNTYSTESLIDLTDLSSTEPTDSTPTSYTESTEATSDKSISTDYSSSSDSLETTYDVSPTTDLNSEPSTASTDVSESTELSGSENTDISTENSQSTEVITTEFEESITSGGTESSAVKEISEFSTVNSEESQTIESTEFSSTEFSSTEFSSTEFSSTEFSSTEFSATESSLTESGSTDSSSIENETSVRSTSETDITEVTDSSESSSFDMSSTEMGSAESTEGTESGITAESTVEETTESGISSESETTESTSYYSTISNTDESTETGISSSTDEFEVTEESHITDLFTSVSSVEKAITNEHKIRKCKLKKKKTCKTSEFGCCFDGVTKAEGPFSKGCPTPHTCKETKYGCCPDDVSPAKGPKNEDCPDQYCNETLFGCCKDGITPAEGNDFEGCKKPCNETEFGCCPDKETAAIGQDNLGCCNNTEFGCCPDGIKSATGPNEKGCEEEIEITETSIETTTVMSGDCADSKYGCCPDGQKPANGTNFEGCDIINTKNCTASYFGCCPDNITAALDQNYGGCHMACDNTTYGCCEDRRTPAHGYNSEGCCLSSRFQCCPDNILPARGLNFEGCGCQYSKFRCCPDNTTAARGPNNEGCGCQYTTHGCCPNRFTPATGPNYEGCPCYTYQFGCCSDGISIAKGSHGQGCGCENTEFKCCSDGRTPAKGPNFAGCSCDASKYGCCPDGIEEAQGKNFEGCLKVPSIPGAACALPRARGPCRDFTVKWYYDTEYGGCSKFWYGGCEGNDNRFKTQEECKAVCVEPTGKDVCFLPKIFGPCEGYYPMWYYDAERTQCGQFIHSGCLGNGNKFKTREECEQRCAEPDDADPCSQTKESGPCEGNFTRWYFNKDRQNCEVFRYGGCKGNHNNYPSELACRQQCLQPGRSRVMQDVCALEKEPGPCPGSLLRWYYDVNHEECKKFIFGGCKGNGNKFRTKAACKKRCQTKDSCSLPRSEGNCTEKYSRWYFDQQENRCMPFYYTGCGGNTNNFDTRDACESDCPPKIEQDVCLLPALLGECHNYTQRWYFDSYEQRCRPFYYGGCGGNDNNFHSENECSNRCEHQGKTPTTPEVEFQSDFCFLPDQRGSCQNYQTKWFYDSREGICKQFVYGGCSSNGNNFNSREECEYRCGEVQDPCTMPVLVGPCNGSVPQFYYDRRADACYDFDYSGCQGNKNRFNDLRTCEHRCRKRSATPTQPSTQATRAPSAKRTPLNPTCLEPVEAGPCDGEVTAYFYDKDAGMCQAFIYGGCEGNANRYETEEQCERLCGTFREQDICHLPPDQGPCRGLFSKYYYDQSTRVCQQFIYGGCDGNANRFSSRNECESVCIHHEEPAQSGNKTALSDLTICKEPVDIGSCSIGNYKRFYYDDEYQTCRAFIYTGCGGNRNNFKTIDSCLKICRQINSIPEDKQDPKNPCEEAIEHCNQIHCPYGQEDYVDSQNCQRCRCVEPCQSVECPEGTKCAVTLVGSNDSTEYRGVCNSVSKPGKCPVVSNSTRCDQECYTDADCTSDQKCCNSGCGTSCLNPASDEIITTVPSYLNGQEFVPPGSVPARIEEPEQPNIVGEEGGYVTMHCIVIGNPQPVAVWRKDAKVIGSHDNRRRILGDGSLQIINLYPYDKGIYVCTADNGIGSPVRIEYQLDVVEPQESSPGIVDEQNKPITVILNSPTILHCYAIGWPRPTVTWWRNDSMLPLSSEHYEQESDNTLRIRSVTLSNLGIYTCHAFNGVGKPAEWSTILQAIGPVANIRPDQERYIKYLVQAPQRPEKPTYPYRPNRTQIHENQTYAPIYTTRRYNIPHVVPINMTTPVPNVQYATPVRVNISASQVNFPEGSIISIRCNVRGYPTPRITWYKNNIPINTDDRIKISETNELSISHSNSNDTGNYRCEGVNQHSSSSESVDINVAGIYIDPLCQDNVHLANCSLIVAARYCQHQYYAKFCCRSCTVAGQLPSRGVPPYANNQRVKRSLFSFL